MNNIKRVLCTGVILVLPLATVFADPKIDWAEVDRQLARLEESDRKPADDRQIINGVWEKLSASMADPFEDDAAIWRRAGRLALAIGEASEPVSGPELAAVTGEALGRLDPDNPESAQLVQALVEFVGQDAIDQLAEHRKAHRQTLSDSRNGVAHAQYMLSVLYDTYMTEAGESPVVRHEQAAIQWLKRAVDGGDSDAMIRMAWRSLDGRGVRRDCVRTDRLLRQAIEAGNWKAESDLWNLYYALAAPLKTDRAVRESLQRRAEQSDTTAMHILGLMMRRGRGGPRDYKEARRLFEACWNAGVTRSAVRLGSMYEHGEGGPKDGRTAVKWFQRGEEQGDLVALHYLGQIYTSGAPGVDPDITKSFRYFQLAANQGYVPSQRRLGSMYGLGMGVKQDPTKGAMWTLKAAKAGDMVAAFNLGMTYYRNNDYVKAARWFQYAETGGAVPANAFLGQMCRDGLGVKQDYHKAMQHFMKLAQPGLATPKGFPNAQTNVGWMYVEGQGVQRDYAKAVMWFRRAADQNYSEGIYSLGLMYEDGTGVDRDLDQAIRLYRQAAKQNNANARKRLQALGVMPPDDPHHFP